MPRTAEPKKKASRKKPRRKKASRKKPRRKKATEFSHPTKKRCSHCRTLMNSEGTREGGKYKRWRCPGRPPVPCNHRETTVGEPV